MNHFKFYSKSEILSHTKIRKYETKLGETVQCLKQGMLWTDSLGLSDAKYVIFGIPEDIGIRANHGIGGADSSWFPFVYSFLNMQSNDFLPGDNIIFLGHFDFDDLKLVIESNAATTEEKIEAYRHATITIDEEVENLVKIITQLEKIPIIIGGGHNNAYPAIKGAAKGLHKKELLPLAQINCINLDAQPDYRPLEGRHSGNAFRYADEDGYLNKYCIVGLHESDLPQNVLDDIEENPFIDFISYEDIFVHEKKNFIQAVAHATGFTEETFTGIDIDLDSIQDVLCSATTPSGITVLHARQFITFVATDAKVAYVHICEGACILGDGRTSGNTGKLIGYLVADFVKAHSNK